MTRSSSSHSKEDGLIIPNPCVVCLASFFSIAGAGPIVDLSLLPLILDVQPGGSVGAIFVGGGMIWQHLYVSSPWWPFVADNERTGQGGAGKLFLILCLPLFM